MKQLLLGIDVGTGGCKTTLIDSDGKFIADGYTDYPTAHPLVGWAEQKAENWFPAFLKSLHIALLKGGASADQIIGLSVDASAHNAVLLDSHDNVLRDTIMWTDQRSTKEVSYLLENFANEIFKIGYQRPSPTWTLPQLMWIKANEPEVFKKIDRIMFIKDYIRYLLTGNWNTDYIEAQGSLLFDNIKWNWSKDLCSMGDISIDLLPPIIKPTDIAGYITKEASALTGIKEGVPVVNGASDTALENYCVGAIKEGHCVVKIATAGTISVFRSKAYPNPKALTYSHVVNGLWYTCLATSSAAFSLRWYRDVFCQMEYAQEKSGGKDVYRMLDEEASVIPAGSEGLIFHPYLMGERSPYWDSKLCGSFTGITAHHTRGHFNRAILEGVAYSIKDNFNLAEKMTDISEVSFVGGGAKSPLWRTILASMLNKPVLKFEKDDSSFGAALLSGVGIGIFKDHEEAIKKSVHLSERVMPDDESHKVYEKDFVFYKNIHDVLAEIYHQSH
jgi:xylulokinase